MGDPVAQRLARQGEGREEAVKSSFSVMEKCVAARDWQIHSVYQPWPDASSRRRGWFPTASIKVPKANFQTLVS
ncbi:MAG: hypothetical protein VCE75_10675 [Alphaproteobacteria bacterium]|jgi:hypothetical protein